jgi:hypothetical protein
VRHHEIEAGALRAVDDAQHRRQVEDSRAEPHSESSLSINRTTIEIDGGMLPGVLCDAGLKTITDLL